MSRKKGYYLHSQSRLSLGVAKKIDMQIKEFSKHVDIEEIEIGVPDRSVIKRVLGLFPTASIERNYQAAIDKMDNPDFIYMRRMVADRHYIKFLKSIKEVFPSCKIIIELYTYPYDKDEFAKWDAWPFYLKELIYRRKQNKYVDRFVTYTDDEKIFNVDTIQTINGIDVEAVNTISGEFDKDNINLMGVAFMQRHHGYERVIKGLAEYYKSNERDTEVTLTLVGDGPEKEMYKRLVENNNLEKYVRFYPNTKGEELEELYESSDIGVCSLGMYKLGLYGKASVLKSREYMAKGMLMLLGCPIDVIDDEYPFAITFANDDSAIDIEKVVAFYKKAISTNEEKKELADIIRKFAKDNVDNAVTLRPIVDYMMS